MSESKIEAFPVKFEIFDKSKELMATIEAQDECCATVKIDAWVCDKIWPELSAKILECLVAMRFE